MIKPTDTLRSPDGLEIRGTLSVVANSGSGRETYVLREYPNTVFRSDDGWILEPAARLPAEGTAVRGVDMDGDMFMGIVINHVVYGAYPAREDSGAWYPAEWQAADIKTLEVINAN